MISQGKYNLSTLMNEILKEPCNREEWPGVAVRPTLFFVFVFFSKEDKSKIIPAASLLPLINLSQETNNFFFFIEHHNKENIL